MHRELRTSHTRKVNVVKALVVEAKMRAVVHGRAIKVFFDDYWRSTRYRGHSRVLHRLDHVGVDTLVVQTDDFGSG